MCTRSLQKLAQLGLNKIVIAEGQNFRGAGDMLESFGYQVLRLSNPVAMEMMENFAQKYPWDWAADIGGIPSDPKRTVQQDLSNRLSEIDYQAAIVDYQGKILIQTNDERGKYGGNPVFSSVMLAMGQAGSAVNLRECALMVNFPDLEEVDLEIFGYSSLGACELFRPAIIFSRQKFCQQLQNYLTQVGIQILGY